MDQLGHAGALNASPLVDDDTTQAASETDLAITVARNPGSTAFPRLAGTNPDLSDADSLQAIADRFPEQLAFVDRSFRIAAVNREWAAELQAKGYAEFRRGGDYLKTLERRIRRSREGFLAVRSAIEQAAGGGGRTIQIAYQDLDSIPATRHYRLNVSPFEWGGAKLAMLTRSEVTDLVILTQHCHTLERSLVLAEGTERRRIGRELHDGTAQQLVALHLTLIRLRQLHPDLATSGLLAEMDEALQGMSREIRTLSYLLHPPALADGSLVDTLEQMASGFGRRTGLEIIFKFEGTQADWGALIETTFYRLAQEALANVHRHAHATQVRMTLSARRGYLRLSLQDNGIGLPAELMPPSKSLGVGIPSMKARMEELNGRFAIRQSSKGCQVIASLPLPPHSELPVLASTSTEKFRRRGRAKSH